MRGVVEQKEVGFLVELGRLDAVLHELEPDAGDLEAGFLHDFAAQGVLRTLVRLDFAAGDAPFVTPFVGLDHEDVALRIEDQRADGGDGRMGRDAAMPFEEVAHFAQVAEEEVGVGALEFFAANRSRSGRRN